MDQQVNAPAKTHRGSQDRWSDALALCIGSVLLLCVYGYQYGRSNHGVYLLDAMHKADPTLLARDWYTVETFQYHAFFGWITAALMKLGIAQSGFLVAYLTLVVLMQLAWLRLVQQLGGDRRTYLVAVLAYLLSAGGTGLGMYQFLQDGCLVPSNIANVALLWAIVFWIRDRRLMSGICVGIAGLFHLNHAIVGPLLWMILVGWDELRWRGIDQSLLSAAGQDEPATRMEEITRREHRSARIRRLILASACALLPSAINVLIAAKLKLGLASAMSMSEWLDLYVRFRHPHHYDPRSWPWSLWLCFLWPIIPAVYAFRTVMRDPRTAPLRRAWKEWLKIVLIFLAILCAALIFAGIFFVSETLVQMSLYRFSIYPHLLCCTAAAWLVCQRLLTPGAQRKFLLLGSLTVTALVVFIIQIAPRLSGMSVEGMRAFVTAKALASSKTGALTMFCLLSFTPVVADLLSLVRKTAIRRAAQAAVMLVLIGAIFIGWGRWIGLIQILDEDDKNYLKLCEFVKQNTPRDAIFLVPPNESMFRVFAQRAIVVNFKCVPQLNAELPAWRDRLQDVLGIADITRLPRGFDKIGPAMGTAYQRHLGSGLVRTAHKYGAAYIVTQTPIQDENLTQIPTPQADYLLYAVKK